MSALFDDRPYRDPDYAAAVEFCQELIPFAPSELLAGTHSANFCPIARTLDRGSVCSIPDDLSADWIKDNGGGSLFFQVDQKRVQCPAVDDWFIDLVGDDPPQEQIERYLAAGYEYDESGGLRLTVSVPEPVRRFIERFDAGAFPSLELLFEDVTR